MDNADGVPDDGVCVHKVSIVTVTLNAEKYLRRTINSVLEQDYRALELIIVDGGSVDGTIDIIHEFESSVAQWISEPDDGPYDAMNKGAGKCTGEWVLFLNAGDMLSDSKVISRLIDADDGCTQIICGGVNYYNENGEHKYYRAAHGLNDIYRPQLPCIHQSALIHIDLVKKLAYSKRYKIAADYEFFLRAFVLGCKFKFVEFAVCDFLLGGLSARNIVLGRAESVNALIEFIPDPRRYAENNGVVSAFGHITNNSRMARGISSFMASLRNIYSIVDKIRERRQKVVVYGAGSLGHLLVSFMNIEDVVAIIDKYSNDKYVCGLKVELPAVIRNLNYDYILISAIGYEDEVVPYLRSELNADLNKIVVFQV